MLIVPIAGFMLYFIFYSRKLHKKFLKRLNELRGCAYVQQEGVVEALVKENAVAASQMTMLCKIADAIGKSIEVTPDMLKTNLLQRFIYSVVRIFAPLM